MSRRVLYIIFYISLLATPVFGQQEEGVFDDEIYNLYDKAYNLNESKDYLSAYRNILLADQSVLTTLSKKHLKASSLSDEEFIYPYWRIKQSKAEIAYMLGVYTDMEAVSNELRLSFREKNWKEGNGIEEIKNGLWATLAKIDGSRYFLIEKYDSSEIALKDALRLGSFYGNAFFMCKVHDDLAQLYYKQEIYDKSLTHLDSILASPLYQLDARNKETEQNIKIVESQRAICLARLARFTEALREIESVCAYFKKVNDKRAYAEALRKKAKILMLQYDSTGKYSPEAISCYQQYFSISRDYIDTYFINMSESEREQYWMTEQPFVTDCFRLEEKAPALLYDVALYSKAVLLQMGRDFKENMSVADKKRALASIRVNWKQVREKLPVSSCAIEYLVYEKKGKNHLGALVVTKKSVSPQFVDIGEVAQISDYLLTERLRVKDVFADTQSKDKINTLYNDSMLCRLIWNDDMVRTIGDNRKVYFSPNGIFYQMGIEYMVPPSLDGKQFYRLTTTRLLTQAKHKVRTDKMLVCGGVEYGLTTEDKEKDNDELAYSLLAPMDIRVAPLPNSAIEIDSIRGVRNKRPEDMVLRADSLTEAALSQLMGKYHIAHISTHGLFSEVAKIGTDIRPSSSDLQLSKSCLFLSGSEKNLRQMSFDASFHDGILSARELAKMDLSNVDLTVLSACMSGLGYITPDGVYGLQRGLKTAGVKTIISTLWSVDDEATCFFIIQLYRNLEKGKSLYGSFWTARETLKKYEKTYGGSSATGTARGSFIQRRRITIPKFNKPYFYNAFILIDGLE